MRNEPKILLTLFGVTPVFIYSISNINNNHDHVFTLYQALLSTLKILIHIILNILVRLALLSCPLNRRESWKLREVE